MKITRLMVALVMLASFALKPAQSFADNKVMWCLMAEARTLNNTPRAFFSRIFHPGDTGTAEAEHLFTAYVNATYDHVIGGPCTCQIYQDGYQAQAQVERARAYEKLGDVGFVTRETNWPNSR